jgi:EAL domain-containing protein (putative c-di-GMP-specific phosphodiesterase class I)
MVSHTERSSLVPHQATSAGDGERDGEELIISAADAAIEASRDAAVVARSAADATTNAHEAVATAGEAASSAREATAVVVAAAAFAAAETAAQAASALHSEAVSRAVEVAASAVLAMETIEADLPVDVDAEVARRVAALVASTVAAAVIAQSELTETAAARVAQAVALAAEVAALAAVAAATVVDEAISTAAASADVVIGSNAATEAASDVAVESTARVADTAQRRAARLRGDPLERELQAGLLREELRLHYQPMYDMESGALVAVEALLRWQHPTRGLLPPSEFLGVAEGPRLVLPVGDWVIRAAITQAAAWEQSIGASAPTVWINICCEQLGRHHLPGAVQEALAGAGLTPGKLGLEITERQLARRAVDVASDLVALRELGVGLAVDDFGTGYASLDYLRMCTFDEIKIDRSFVAGLDVDRTDTAVISSIIALGRSLDLAVVAEGVETWDQYTRLQQMGCTVSQGYLHHRPVPATTLATLMGAGHEATVGPGGPCVTEPPDVPETDGPGRP